MESTPWYRLFRRTDWRSPDGLGMFEMLPIQSELVTSLLINTCNTMHTFPRLVAFFPVARNPPTALLKIPIYAIFGLQITPPLQSWDA